MPKCPLCERQGTELDGGRCVDNKACYETLKQLAIDELNNIGRRRREIETLYRQGYTPTVIAKMLGMKRKTSYVYTVINKMRRAAGSAAAG